MIQSRWCFLEWPKDTKCHPHYSVEAGLDGNVVFSEAGRALAVMTPAEARTVGKALAEMADLAEKQGRKQP